MSSRYSRTFFGSSWVSASSSRTSAAVERPLRSGCGEASASQPVEKHFGKLLRRVDLELEAREFVDALFQAR